MLTAILQPEKAIISAKVLNPSVPKTHLEDKGIELDILVRLDDGQIVNVEMQIGRQAYLLERASFYGARAFAAQLTKGKRYQSLRPVTVICLLNHEFFRTAEEHYHLVFLDREMENRAVIRTMIAKHFIEIPKAIRWLRDADKDSEQKAENALNWWIKFLYNPYDISLAEAYQAMPALKRSKLKLDLLAAEPSVQELARMREHAEIDYNSNIYAAEQRGKAEGLAEGRAEGRAETFRALLAKLSLAEVADLFGMSEDEVAKVLSADKS